MLMEVLNIEGLNIKHTGESMREVALRGDYL